MKETIIVSMLAAIFGFGIGGAIFQEDSPPYKVVEAKRLDDCTYQVGLEDKDGLYFSLTQDLVKFAAMGVDVNDILIFGEQ